MHWGEGPEGPTMHATQCTDLPGLQGPPQARHSTVPHQPSPITASDSQDRKYGLSEKQCDDAYTLRSDNVTSRSLFYGTVGQITTVLTLMEIKPI